VVWPAEEDTGGVAAVAAVVEEDIVGVGAAAAVEDILHTGAAA
jgi:hypothetical protein